MRKWQFLLFVLVLSCCIVIAQSGVNDPTFDPGAGPEGGSHVIYNVSVQPDSKILISGSFLSINEMACINIARLNLDGSVDTSFSPEVNIESYVSQTLIQPDGKILVGQSGFTSGSNPRVTRLNTDGSVDTTFVDGVAGGGYIEAIALQFDGKILVGGSFVSYNGIARGNVARLNTNGSLDTSFIPEIDIISGQVFQKSLISQPDGKVLIGGEFYINGVYKSCVIRLNSNGSLDTSFIQGVGNGARVLKLQPDGKILIGTSIGGSAAIVRLKADGSEDTSFNMVSHGNIFDFALEPNGKILVGGSFYYVTAYNGTSSSGLVRLNTDGGIDTTFLGNGIDAGNGNGIHSIALQPDGKILIGGRFTHYNGISRKSIARILNCAAPATSTSTLTACGSYTWVNGDGQIYTSDTTVTHTIPNGAANGCDSVATLHLTIPNIDTTVSINNGTLTAVQVGANYQWLDCTNGNVPVSGATSQSYTPTNNGVYAVQITSGTCKATSECIVVNSLAIETIPEYALFIQPNPNNGIFHIEIPGFSTQADIKILNMAGQMVYVTQIHSENTTVNLSALSSGMYILLLDSDKGTVQKKIVIR